MIIRFNHGCGFNLTKSVEATSKEFWVRGRHITGKSVFNSIQKQLPNSEYKLTQKAVENILNQLCIGELTAPLTKHGEVYAVIREKLLASFIEIKPPRKRGKSIVSLISKPKLKRKVRSGMDKVTFHQLYGCFGVAEVVKGGRYLYNKSSANTIRRKVHAHCHCHKPLEWMELINWLRHLVKENKYRVTKQSIQIGIIQALQSTNLNHKEIYAILSDAFRGNLKLTTYEDIEIRENAKARRLGLYGSQ